MLILKAAALAIVICVLALCLKKDQPGFAFLVSVCGALCLLAMSVAQIEPVIRQLRELAALVEAPSFGILLRVLAIALIAQLAADLCRECGLASAGFCVELFGRVLAMMEALPLLQSLVQSFLSFLP
ncbi:MAG: stage III sporulation AC/AD family protein [Gemmiger sp.]|nr:stage III sporulation AC/AD family protein [Gemmiger sp.]MDY5782303.1 stage III sporulation AC/AD family protein [Gemmiger sp.]